MLSTTKSVAAAAAAEEKGSFSTEELEAASAAAVAEKMASFSTKDKKAHSPAVSQDAGTVADVKEEAGPDVKDAGAVADGKEAAADVKAVADAEAAAASADGYDCPPWMTKTQFVVAYKRLSREEINSILSKQRKPFESTDIYQDMIADNSTSKEDLERKAALHKEHEDFYFDWQDWVRKEYAAKGIVEVDDDYIADRVEMEAYFYESWSKMVSELNLDESHFGYDDDDE